MKARPNQKIDSYLTSLGACGAPGPPLQCPGNAGTRGYALPLPPSPGETTNQEILGVFGKFPAGFGKFAGRMFSKRFPPSSGNLPPGMRGTAAGVQFLGIPTTAWGNFPNGAGRNFPNLGRNFPNGGGNKFLDSPLAPPPPGPEARGPAEFGGAGGQGANQEISYRAVREISSQVREISAGAVREISPRRGRKS